MTSRRSFLLLSLAFSVIVGGVSTGCNSADGSADTEKSAPVLEEKNTPEEPSQVDTRKDVKVPTGNTKIKISTSKGDMIVMLYDDTPLHRDNFIKLTKEGFFNDLLFHRVIKDFMIQGGDPNSKGAPAGMALGNGGPGYTVPAEFLDYAYHKKGALAAARQSDQVNPQRASSGSQFYIVQGRPVPQDQLLMMEKQKNRARSPENPYKYSEKALKDYETLGGTPFLDDAYTVFGEVVEGLEVLDAIAAVATAPGDRPLEDIAITVTIIE